MKRIIVFLIAFIPSCKVLFSQELVTTTAPELSTGLCQVPQTSVIFTFDDHTKTDMYFDVALKNVKTISKLMSRNNFRPTQALNDRNV